MAKYEVGGGDKGYVVDVKEGGKDTYVVKVKDRVVEVRVMSANAKA